MIGKNPLKNVIQDIKDDKVFFKGQKGDEKVPTSPDQQEKTVAQMASRAALK
jgi:hypothetical protein